MKPIAQVIVLSVSSDEQLSLVRPHLEDAGAEVVVIGPEDLASGAELSFYNGRSGREAWFGDTRLGCPGRPTSLWISALPEMPEPKIEPRELRSYARPALRDL